MEFSRTNFSFLMFAGIVGFLLMQLQILPLAAAISCGHGETETESQSTSTSFLTQPKIYCTGCQNQCANQCESQGRQVSQVECNFWGSEPAVCKCCCGKQSSTPPPKPIAWNQCPNGDINKYKFLKNSQINCTICVNHCKTSCDGIGATVTRETCIQNYNTPSQKLKNGELLCPCCCKPNPPPPPPSPPPPPPASPPPPPPSPPPSPPPPPPPSPPPPPPPSPPPSSENTCDAEDKFIAFNLPSTKECGSCASRCKTKCSALGGSVAKECCIRKPSEVSCSCCCKGNPPPTATENLLSFSMK